MLEFRLTIAEDTLGGGIEVDLLDMKALNEMISDLCDDEIFYQDYCDWIDEIFPPANLPILGEVSMSTLIRKIDEPTDDAIYRTNYFMYLWEQIEDTLATEDIFEGPCGLKITRISKENPLIS